MLIQIESGDAQGPRKVVVSDGDQKIAAFTAPSLAEAHKMIKCGRRDGWGTLTKGK